MVLDAKWGVWLNLRLVLEGEIRGLKSEAFEEGRVFHGHGHFLRDS